MKKTLCVTALLLLSVVSLMADNTAIVGIWSTLTVGREMDYYKFTEDNKCSHWMTVASSETGELKTYWDYTDVPYTYDEENMILTVNISDGTTKRWEFDSLSADRFVVKGDWISYYREAVDAIKEGANITFEDVDLHGATYYDGADNSGLFATADVFSFMNYSHDGSWCGFGVSATNSNIYTGNTTDGSLFNSVVGGGMQSDKFAVGCYNESLATLEDEYPEIYATGNIKPEYVYITNTACAYKSMTEGDSFVKKFDETDWLKLTISGMVFSEEEIDYVVANSVDFYLAKDGKIVNEWTKVDLTPLGVCEFIRFSISSSVSGLGDVSSLSYFALDNMKAEMTEEEATALQVVETKAAVKAKKLMKDGKIIIMNNGKQLNVAGQEM